MQLTALSISLLLPLLASSVQGQSSNSTSNSTSGFLQQVVSGLQSAGFSELATTLFKINGTVPGNQLFARLQNGSSFLFFAPDNTAVQSIQSSVSSNATLLAEYLSYHFVEGQFTNTSFTNTSSGGGTSSTTSTVTQSSTSTESSVQTPSARANVALFRRLFGTKRQDSSNSSSNPQPFAGIWPNTTIGRTLLNSSDFVNLEGNKSQVLAWDRSTPNGNVTLLNQARNITVVNGTVWNNILIQGINGTLIPPGNLSTALVAVNATAAENLFSTVQVPASNGTNETVLDALQQAKGVTIFLPNNEAFTSDVNSTLSSFQNNTNATIALLQNHIINGTSLYSTEISNSTQAVSAAGESLSFLTNDTGIFVTGGNNSVAQIVRPDVLISNGVVHIIDRVLFDTNQNPEQAQSAYASATSEAAISTTESGPITGVAGGSSQTQSSSQSSSSSESTVTATATTSA